MVGMTEGNGRPSLLFCNTERVRSGTDGLFALSLLSASICPSRPLGLSESVMHTALTSGRRISLQPSKVAQTWRIPNMVTDHNEMLAGVDAILFPMTPAVFIEQWRVLFSRRVSLSQSDDSAQRIRGAKGFVTIEFRAWCSMFTNTLEQFVAMLRTG